ncbi:MAG: hypothetical protein JWQ71_1104, partial [Pedosphaera sp.]|nr:hypothetical protein [Pedosphaera sp.]
MSGTIIEDKERLEEQFLSFLHDLNYPEDSIFRGPSFQIEEAARRRLKYHGALAKPLGTETEGEDPFPCYADLAILDLESHEYTCLIEFRLQLNEQIEMEMADFFRTILESLDAKPPVFLVIPQPNSAFRIYQLRENGIWQELPRKSFPHYPTLVAGHAAEKSLNREAKEEKAWDRFSSACYVVAGIVALIVIASIGGLNALTPSQ